MLKKSLKLLKIVPILLLIQNSYSSNNIEQLSEVEQILNMNTSFSNIKKNIETTINNPQQKEHIENFYHYVFGNNSYNLVVILSYGTPNVLNNISSILNINTVKNYLKTDGIENKVLSAITGIQKQFIETDIYGTFVNTQESKDQFKNIYSYMFNKTFDPYFNEINNFNKSVVEFRRSNRNMYGNDTIARNIINTIQNCFNDRTNFLNNKKNITINNWEDIFNKALKYQEEQNSKNNCIQN